MDGGREGERVENTHCTAIALGRCAFKNTPKRSPSLSLSLSLPLLPPRSSLRSLGRWCCRYSPLLLLLLLLLFSSFSLLLLRQASSKTKQLQ